MKLLPRNDIRPEEGCFICYSDNDKKLGYVQVFKDGTCGYWTTLMEPAKPAATPEIAMQILQRQYDLLLSHKG